MRRIFIDIPDDFVRIITNMDTTSIQNKMNTTNSRLTEITIHPGLPAGQEEITHQFIAPSPRNATYLFTVPELNFYLAGFNTINRITSQKPNLALFRYLIRNGRFDYEVPDPVTFDWNGILVSGATRMLAHLLEEKEYPSLVCWGRNPAVRKGFDLGQPKTPAQHYIINQQRAVTKAENQKVGWELAAVRILYAAERLEFKRGIKRMDLHDIHDYYVDNVIEIEQACRRLPDVFAKNYKRAGFRAALAVYFRHDADKARIFSDLVNGPIDQPLDKKTAVARCRLLLERSVGGGNVRQALDFQQCLWLCYCDYINKPVGKKLGTLMRWPREANEAKAALSQFEETLPLDMAQAV